MSHVNFGSNDQSNPYQTSSLASSSVQPTNDHELLQSMISVARWQTFFAVLGFIGSGFMLLALAFQFALVARNGVGIAIGSGAVLLAAALLCYVVPAVLLWRAASSTRSFANSGAPALSEVFKAQRAFWKYIGVLVCIVLVIYLFIGLFVLAIAGAGAARRF